MPKDDSEKRYVIWSFLANKAESEGIASSSTGVEISSDTDSPPSVVNSSIKYLVDTNLVTWERSSQAEPYIFSRAKITPRGLFEIRKVEEESPEPSIPAADRLIPISPVGSPYGFTTEDFATLSAKKEDSDTLYVVLGHQYESNHFDREELRQNVSKMFSDAVKAYNDKPDAPKTKLAFTSLAAGYGEHLFNEIARDIISADIAVFETSDLNPNVMIEMGVALTWGVMVLPIKHEGCGKPPSDISGQTWADYSDSAYSFIDRDHHAKLVNLVERAVRRKSQPTNW